MTGLLLLLFWAWAAFGQEVQALCVRLMAHCASLKLVDMLKKICIGRLTPSAALSALWHLSVRPGQITEKPYS
jgi:hypothetical protein